MALFTPPYHFHFGHFNNTFDQEMLFKIISSSPYGFCTLALQSVERHVHNVYYSTRLMQVLAARARNDNEMVQNQRTLRIPINEGVTEEYPATIVLV